MKRFFLFVKLLVSRKPQEKKLVFPKSNTEVGLDEGKIKKAAEYISARFGDVLVRLSER